MRIGSAVALVAVAALLTGCSDDVEPEIVRPPAPVTTTPAFDTALQPAAAVMAVVPADATVLEVTDYDQVRFSLGYGDLSSASPTDVLRRFWAQAERQAPLLSRGILRTGGVDTRALGFSQDDVSWEAHFSGPSGEGYVVKFRDDQQMGGVQRAARTPGSPLRGATVVPSFHLAAVGATSEPSESWAAEPELMALVGTKAGATYVSRDCLSLEEAFGRDVSGDLAPTPAADLAALAELGPFSVGFGGTLVTARLGAGRSDVFERARLAGTMPATDPDFGLGYRDPVVGDPSGGRIGFRLGDGPVAARLAHERQLPFAVCAQ